MHRRKRNPFIIFFSSLSVSGLVAICLQADSEGILHVAALHLAPGPVCATDQTQ